MRELINIVVISLNKVKMASRKSYLLACQTLLFSVILKNPHKNK